MIRLSVDFELQRPFIFFLRQEESSKQAVIRKEREEVQNTLRIASSKKETRKKFSWRCIYIEGVARQFLG